MFWLITLATVIVLLTLGWWVGRRHVATDLDLERRRRQLGIQDGRGHGALDR
jgi:hypothetical protein